MNEISRSNVVSLLSANQRLLERLEAENAQLRGRVAELMLEIQALRDALGHPQSDTQPNRCHRPSGTQ
jgi:predicted RNase H-like nuclease (RuvC/YqgF family)